MFHLNFLLKQVSSTAVPTTKTFIPWKNSHTWERKKAVSAMHQVSEQMRWGQIQLKGW